MKQGINALFTILVFSVSVYNISGQTKADGSTPQFLFPEFTKGDAIMKTGISRSALMNYNTVSEKMVFQQGGRILEMTETERIDTVSILGRKFIPAGKVFYELLLKNNISLFVQHKGDLMLPGKPVPYGGTSQTTSSSTVVSLEYDSRYVNMKLPADYTVNNKNIFWIMKNGAMTDFMSEKQFLKIFPEKNTELKKYIKESKVKFDRIPDIQKLVIYCNEID